MNDKEFQDLIKYCVTKLINTSFNLAGDGTNVVDNVLFVLSHPSLAERDDAAPSKLFTV